MELGWFVSHRPSRVFFLAFLVCHGTQKETLWLKARRLKNGAQDTAGDSGGQ